MAVQKPSIPKGTRDFSPIEMARRNYIFNTIRRVFRLFGYMPIETPAMENLSTLMGKYGEEGDKLLFKILNSGDFMTAVDDDMLNSRESLKIAPRIAEKGLRYDLTVPFARYVVQHRNDIKFPFKRYQIQPVWRADRPQKGRYREFYQCDADVIGSKSLNNEIELLQIIDSVFSQLGINIVIKLNNRKVLAGIAEIIGSPDSLTDITVAIDKIEKIGIDAVNEELKQKGLDDEAIRKLQPFLEIGGDTAQRMNALQEKLAASETGMKGIEELEYIFNGISELGMKCDIELDVSLARGLNYYTGAIIEVKAKDYAIGSITGGGRYDNLTGIFGLPDVSGVGISFGADRIYDVLTGLELFPAEASEAPQVLFVNLGMKESLQAMKSAALLHSHGISAEVYPDEGKLKKQLSYASDCSIPYVAIIGEDELNNNTVTIKNMLSGEQHNVKTDEITEYFKQ